MPYRQGNLEALRRNMEIPHTLNIAGGGLSGLVTAWRVLSVNANITVDIFEKSQQVGGDHTWSFNETDIAPGLRDWFEPFTAHRWPRYDVKFPNRRRTLDIAYRTGNSDTLRACIDPFIKEGRLRLHLGREAPMDRKPYIIDARGFELREDEHPGWQKFMGRVIRTKSPHGLDHPVIMDATVEQADGYRFVYLLPFSEYELLVEDTYFSDTPDISKKEISARIDEYIRGKGWADHQVVRTETGVLPMMMATDRLDESLQIGLRGGFAVAATGFTVPHAVEVADVIAQTIRKDGVDAVPNVIAGLRASHLRRERYARLLNRIFFRAAEPSKRYRILERFYGLNEGLIRRFYRNELRWHEKLRILIGKPPVPVHKALINMSENAFLKRERARDRL